jgi:hypothetical protein
MTFPKINKQARGIAALYKWFGLYSIPLLTVVTIISISNVFTRGALANSSGLEMAWAVVFATAIEVNIVRLFFEWKLDKDNGALVLGIGLVFVAGVALLIEGLQQSIGFTWSNLYVQIVVGVVVGLRVLVVVLLLAREGSRLASAMVDDVQPLYACLVHFDAPAQPESVQEDVQPSVQDTDTKLHIVHAQSDVRKKRTPATRISDRKIRAILDTDPRISTYALAQKLRVSPTTARNYKKRLAKEA